MNSQTSPLSWILASNSQSAGQLAAIEELALVGDQKFLSYGEICGQLCPSQFYKRLTKRFPKGFYIRGCSMELASEFAESQSQAICFGSEAIIKLDHYKLPISVSKICTRAQRTTNVIEITGKTADDILKNLQPRTNYALKPKLRKLFRASINHQIRCFVVESNNLDKVFALLTISARSQDEYHLELLIRAKDAPAGSVESAIVFIINQLKSEGSRELSLGEAPFHPSTELWRVRGASTYQTKAIIALTKSFLPLLARNYNFTGLANFKNKFNPSWKPVYWCAYPKFSLLNFAAIGYRTNVYKLCSPL